MPETSESMKEMSKPPVGGFWSTQTLRERLGNIVRPCYDESQTRAANHRLAMGSEYFVTKSALDTDVARTSTVSLKPGESFCIPSGHFGFLLTEEKICMPNDAIGFLSIQTDVKFLGLVNISGFHVDPGSNGKIIFAVFNAGPTPVHIRRGDKIFRLWIASLDAVDEEPRSQPSHASISSETVNRISGDLESLQTLAKRVEKMECDLGVHKKLMFIGGPILISMFAVLIIISLNIWFNFERIEPSNLPQTSEISNPLQPESQTGPRIPEK